MNWQRLITHISRLLVGVLFIVSGLIKANDPVGFAYKLDEYFEVFKVDAVQNEATGAAEPVTGAAGKWNDFMDWLKGGTVLLSIAICAVEVGLGVALLVGAFPLLTVWLLLLMILFFTFLTGWSAITDTVTDCGCFGDALKLEPVESFYKDLVLLFFIIILFIFRRYITPLFPRRSTNRAITWVGFFGTVLFSFFAWYYIPPIDFRPYAIGNDICELMKAPEGERTTDLRDDIYWYKKDGKEYPFKLHPVSSQFYSVEGTDTIYWTEEFVWVRTEENIIEKAYDPPIHGFIISDKNGANVTDAFLSSQGYRLMVVQYDLAKSNLNAQKEVNALVQDLIVDGRVKIWGLSCTSTATVIQYEQAYKLPYQLYSMDCTPLKTMIRSNPGLILMKGCKVVNMWSSHNVPEAEELLEDVGGEGSRAE